MLVNSPDTTALFFNTSFAEQSHREVDHQLGPDNPVEFQASWAREWISAPIPIERINAQVLDVILSNECTRNTLIAYNGRLISQLLSDKNYDPSVISQLLELGGFTLDNGHEYAGLIDYLILGLLNDQGDLLESLRCLKALSIKLELKAMIKKHSKINKLYKKLTNMLKHDDDNAVRYALYLLIAFLSETSLGKKLFNESSIMEAFVLLFSTPSLHNESTQKDPIFKDLLGLMLDNRDYSLLFEKFVAENWKNELKWCGSKSLDAIIAITEILKRNLLEDLVRKSIEKFAFYDLAILYVVKHFSNDSLEFINVFLERCSEDMWCLNYLKLVFSITKQFRTCDPFLNLYLDLNQANLPRKKDYDLQITANKCFSNDLKENGQFPPCFKCILEDLQCSKDNHSEMLKKIQEKLYSKSKDTVLSALIEIQSIDKLNLESFAEYVINIDSPTIHDSSLDIKIDDLDKQLMNAVEESKRFLVLKDELMKTKMDMMKQKIEVAVVEQKNLLDKYDNDIRDLKSQNTKLADNLRSLSMEYEKIKNSFAAKDKNIEALSKQNEEKDQIVKELENKILELEESIGEQEEEHQEMVAKLAQSLDSLANRKTRFNSKKTSPVVPLQTVDSLGRNLESTRI